MLGVDFADAIDNRRIVLFGVSGGSLYRFRWDLCGGVTRSFGNVNQNAQCWKAEKEKFLCSLPAFLHC
jgi:hypothetical protein